MDTIEIRRGDIVDATTAGGRRVAMRALTGPQRGHDFTVVWVCTEDEWLRAQEAQDDADGIPWPVEAVNVR